MGYKDGNPLLNEERKNKSWKSILEKRLYRMMHDDGIYEYYESGYIYARIEKSSGDVLFEIGFGIEYRKVNIKSEADLEMLERILE